MGWEEDGDEEHQAEAKKESISNALETVCSIIDCYCRSEVIFITYLDHPRLKQSPPLYVLLWK